MATVRPIRSEIYLAPVAGGAITIGEAFVTNREGTRAIDAFSTGVGKGALRAAYAAVAGHVPFATVCWITIAVGVTRGTALAAASRDASRRRVGGGGALVTTGAAMVNVARQCCLTTIRN